MEQNDVIILQPSDGATPRISVAPERVITPH